MQNLVKNMANYFLYFAYGSNLLQERLLLKNPSAVFVTNGFVKDNKLTFNTYNANSWCGCVATIENIPGEITWGVVWKLEDKHRISLDSQEGVKNKVYEPVDLTVTSSSGEEYKCLSYRCLRVENVTPPVPSPYYRDIILKGAVSSGLPEEYIEKLKSIQHNGYSGECQLYKDVLDLIKEPKL